MTEVCRRPMMRALLLTCGLFVVTPRWGLAQENKPSKEEAAKFFVDEVKPILIAKCAKCHGATDELEGGLQLTTREAILKGGESGPSVSLTEPEDSALLSAINYEDFEMPPKGKLSPKAIDTLTKWVKLGVPWGGDAVLVKMVKAGAANPSPTVNAETKKFWSHQRVERPDTPRLANSEWARTPIDAFILRKLRDEGLTPAEPADKTVLLRRAYYNLTGLPPSAEDVREFLADTSPGAYEKVVDRLLASPRYAEHWARHWLDLVRFAETNSYERDGLKPNAWRYRDYVIRSFHEDKPYSTFIRQQLAGDEVENATAEDLIATGYYRLGIWDDEPPDRELALYDDLDDILSVTGQVFLGMTINCARCHDHKLDPVSLEDYYRMLAFLAGVNRFGVRGGGSVAESSLRSIGTPEQKQRQAAAITEHKVKLEANRAEIKKIEQRVRKDFQPVEREEFKHEMNKIPLVRKRVPKVIEQATFDAYVALKKRSKELKRFQPPALDMALCVTEVGTTPREMFVLARGNPRAKGKAVSPGFPRIFGDPDPQPATPNAAASTSGRRTQLADWIADETNPRTARVIVNRVWQYHFGQPIVGSPNEFGMQGLAPTHPELLDWLASEFVAGGWKFKRLHKLIMLSNAYRMSSRGSESGLSQDPQNNHLWRFNMRRLGAEEIRDSILAVNGALNREKMYGLGVYTIIPKEVLAGQSRPGAGWGKSPPGERNRRSIYIHVKRSLLTPILESFDAPPPDGSCPVRFSTAQPTQSLAMLNGEFINREARVLADDLRKNAGSAPVDQVRTALERTLQRQPTKSEIERGVALINTLRKKHNASEQAALESFCIVALNLNEFLYLD